MASFGSWLWGASQIDDAVDKATSELLPTGTEDIALNLEICDQIRSKSAPPRDTMRAIKRRLNHKNPNVQLLALSLTDTCVKNGGDHFLVEIASREFMDNLASILKIPSLNNEVKNAALRLVQNWSVAFEGKPSLSYVGTVYSELTRDGFKFPPKDMSIANSAMVDTKTAPEWIDSDVCLRCRDSFSFTNRKHHCRNCGLVFDNKCSSKTIPLPHYGITQEVRVCEGCYAKLFRNKERSEPKRHRASNSMHNPRHRAAQELADNELQRAIQLSLQEVNGSHSGYVPSQPPAWQYSEPPIVDQSTRPGTEEEDPDLRAAIEASLRESRAPAASAPVSVETPRSERTEFSYSNTGYSQSYPPRTVATPQVTLPNHELEPLESDAIMTFSQTMEQVQGQGGRDISRYPAVSELYDKASSLRPKLAVNLDDTNRKEEMLKDMHDKMSQIVKLYDNILTEQVSHPRWRAPAAPSPAQQSYSPQQWAQSPQQYQPQQQPLPPRDSQTPRPFAHQYQQGPPPEQQFASMRLQSPVPPQASAYGMTQQQPSYQSAPPLSPVSPPPVSIPQYNPQRSSSLSYGAQHAPSAPTPQPQYAPTAPAPQPQYQYQQQPSAPLAAPPPPPPSSQQQQYQQQQQQQPPRQTTPRQQTYPHHQHQYQQYAPQQQQPHQQQQQPHQQMPQFPTAPTSAPQAFDMYAPGLPVMSPPAAVVQEERKEALLIDL